MKTHQKKPLTFVTFLYLFSCLELVARLAILITQWKRYQDMDRSVYKKQIRSLLVGNNSTME